MIQDALIISLKVSIISSIISLIISVLLLYKTNNKKINIIENLILIPIFIPPSALGYILLKIFSKQSIIGKLLNEYLNIQIIFTIIGAIIVSIIITMPIMYESIKQAINSIDEEIIYSAMDCGANRYKVFTKIILPLSKKGIYSGMLLSFARSFGEFGATMLVAGNIPSKTQTLSMAMYYSIESGQGQISKTILTIILIIALFMISIYKYLEKQSGRK